MSFFTFVVFICLLFLLVLPHKAQAAKKTRKIKTTGDVKPKQEQASLKESDAEPEKNDAKTKHVRQIVTFETTQGVFKAELFDDLAPKTAGNFAELVSKKFYDGTIFHRVIDEFMIQGGDPTGTGTGGPGYKIKDEFGEGLLHSSEGILSMANAGPDSGGSQFFITLIPTPWLDGKHAIFGRIVSGQDVVNAIGKVKVSVTNKPLEDVIITSLTITH